MNVITSINKLYRITNFAPEQKNKLVNIIISFILSFISLVVFSFTCKINLDGYYECIYFLGYLGIYIGTIFADKRKNASYIIPVSRKELIAAYIIDSIKWIFIISFIVVVLDRFFSFGLIISDSINTVNMYPLIGLQIFGINLFTFGYKDLFHRICAILIGYLFFYILGAIELSYIFKEFSYITAVVICSVITIMIVVAGFAANYHRTKPRVYKANNNI